MVKCWTEDFIPGRSCGRIFFSWVNFLCWLILVSVLQYVVARKGHCSFCQKYRWQATAKHAYIALTSLSWSGLAMLSRHRVGTMETGSQGTPQGMLVHRCFSSLSHCGLIHRLKSVTGAHALHDLHFKKKKKKQAAIIFVEPSPIILACEEKATTTTSIYRVQIKSGWLAESYVKDRGSPWTVLSINYI